jgi:hypothetical protein
MDTTYKPPWISSASSACLASKSAALIPESYSKKYCREESQVVMGWSGPADASLIGPPTVISLKTTTTFSNSNWLNLFYTFSDGIFDAPKSNALLAFFFIECFSWLGL